MANVLYFVGARYILRSNDSGNFGWQLVSVKRLDLNLIASLAFRIGYDAYHREMHRLSTTNTTSQTLRSGEREYFRLLDD